jgi:gliding motility-associated-like protein
MKALPVVLAVLFWFTNAKAQYITTNSSLTPQQLVQALVGGSCAQVSNVSASGWANASGNTSYAYFDATGTGFPFQNGIMLASGLANSAQGPNNLIISDGPGTWAGDTDLNAALGMTETFNATVLEFDFVPYTNVINFNYIFSSEEYIQNLQQNACDYTDGFAFLLKEAGSSAPYQNLALIPGTNIPVMVTTVRGEGSCPSANIEYFGGYNNEEHPTNYNGQTVVMTAHADVIPGVTYHIKLVVADQGDTLFDSAIFFEGGSFSAVADLGADRLISTGNPLCNGQTLPVNATAPGAGGYQWYKDGNAIPGATNAMYTIASAGLYTVDVQFIGTCVAQGKIRAEYTPALPAGPFTLLQCDDDTDRLTLYNLQNIAETITAAALDVTVNGYYTTQANANAGTGGIDAAIPFYNTAANQQLYVKVKNQYGCEGVVTVVLSTPSAIFSAITPLEECDTDGEDDGLFNFNLTATEADILAALPAGLTLDFYESYNNALAQYTPLPESLYTNTTPGGQMLYARINNGPDCYGIAQVPLLVHYFGTLPSQNVFMCNGSPVQLIAPGGMASYSWNTDPVQNTQTIMAAIPATYMVTVTGADGCEGTKLFYVNHSGAAQGADYIIDDFKAGGNSINIRPKGEGLYEYSLDGVRYQLNPLFQGLTVGEYRVHIRDVNGCGPEYKETVYILDYPNFFTPNNDGVNDVWQINNLKSRPALVVDIYDRYGKPLISFQGNTGWNGTLNNHPLPATDYWFSITLENGRVVRGHFSLLR